MGGVRWHPCPISERANTINSWKVGRFATWEGTKSLGHSSWRFLLENCDTSPSGGCQPLLGLGHWWNCLIQQGLLGFSFLWPNRSIYSSGTLLRRQKCFEGTREQAEWNALPLVRYLQREKVCLLVPALDKAAFSKFRQGLTALFPR